MKKRIKNSQVTKRRIKTIKRVGRNTRMKQPLSKTMVVTKETIPIQYNYKVKTKNPILNSSNNSITVCHTEFVLDVTTSSTYSGGFVINKFVINPGLKKVFTWLSLVANNYESYNFISCKMFYKPAVSTQIQGQVFIGCDFDPSKQPPESKKDFKSKEYADSNHPYMTLTLDPTTSDLNKEKTHYVRVQGLDISKFDIKLLDCANYYFGYNGVPASTTLGEIYFEYCVKLITPTLNLGAIGINNAESCAARNVIGNSVVLPFGSGLLQQILGQFTQVGAKYVENTVGTNLGHLFTFGKSVAKYLTGWVASAAGLIAPPLLPLFQIFQYIASNTDTINSQQSGLTIIDDDADEHMLLVATGDVRMVDVSASNVKVVLSDNNTLNGHRIFKVILNIPAGNVLRITGAVGSTTPVSGAFYMTDGNFSTDEYLTVAPYIN